MTAEEIVKQINLVQDNKSIYLPEYQAYAVNQGGYRGVAFDCESDTNVKESFSHVCLARAKIYLKGVWHMMIFLYTEDKYLDEHYGALCLDFLNTKKREDIAKNPLEWFEAWKNLLGNTEKKMMIFDVIGEMETLLLLQKAGKAPKWDSINKGTFDISTSEGLYEVKTTKNKTESFITIHSQFQLDAEGKDNLHIAFVRVEENDGGESIDSLCKELNDAHYSDIASVEKYLNDLGYYEGKSERYTKYMIHEVRDYPVNDKFPKITKDSFKEGHFPSGIVKVEYTISLDGLEYTSLLGGQKEDVKDMPVGSK